MEIVEDDYELRARNVQGINPPFWPMPLPPVSVPKGLSEVSSIAPIEDEPPAPIHHPSLFPPQANIMYRLAPLRNKADEQMGAITALFDEEMAQSRKETDRFSEEQAEVLRKEAETAKARSTWETVSHVATYIAGFGSMSLAYTVGGIPGLLIGGAGFVGIANQAAKDTQIRKAMIEWYTHSANEQKRIAQNIEMLAFYLQTGLGLAGGVAAWQSGALAAALDPESGVGAVKKIASTVATASGIASAGAQVGMQMHQKEFADLSARMRELDTLMTGEHHNMTQSTSAMNRLAEIDQSDVEHLKQILRSLEVHQD